jgi:hypothetical protein
MNIAQLIKEHEYLDALAARLEVCLCHPVSAADDAVAIRAEFSAELATHLAAEESAIYGRAAASNDDRLIDEADQMQRELDVLRVDWMAYLSEWTDDVIQGDWETFAAETRTMMARLSSRIARENACLLPLALQRSVLRLKAAA